MQEVQMNGASTEVQARFEAMQMARSCEGRVCTACDKHEMGRRLVLASLLAQNPKHSP